MYKEVWRVVQRAIRFKCSRSQQHIWLLDIYCRFSFSFVDLRSLMFFFTTWDQKVDEIVHCHCLLRNQGVRAALNEMNVLKWVPCKMYFRIYSCWNADCFFDDICFQFHVILLIGVESVPSVCPFPSTYSGQGSTSCSPETLSNSTGGSQDFPTDSLSSTTQVFLGGFCKRTYLEHITSSVNAFECGRAVTLFQVLSFRMCPAALKRTQFDRLYPASWP